MTHPPNYSEYDRPVPHARSGRDGRQEGRECSYYHLHCYLNNTLFHFLINSFLILYSCLSLCSRLRRIASHWGLALPQPPLDGVWHCRNRLSMGSGTDVKSLCDFAAEAGPSARRLCGRGRPQCGAGARGEGERGERRNLRRGGCEGGGMWTFFGVFMKK